jgi:hypothetical protein
LMESGARIRDAAHQVIAWIDEKYVDTIPVDGMSEVIHQDEAEFVPT